MRPIRRSLHTTLLVAALIGAAACSAPSNPPADAGALAQIPDAGPEDAGSEDAGTLADAGPEDAGMPCDPGPDFTGEVSWYEPASSEIGACSVALDFPHFAAVSPARWGGAGACGSCLEITGPDGKTVRVHVADQCPECATDQVDLGRAAFEQLAAPAVGRLQDVTVTPVRCDDEGNIEYRFAQSTNSFYVQVVIWNHAQPIAQVELRPHPGGGEWVPLQRESYNAFTFSAQRGPLPAQVSFRVTDVHGNALVDMQVPVAAGSVFEGGGQFPLTCGG